MSVAPAGHAGASPVVLLDPRVFGVVQDNQGAVLGGATVSLIDASGQIVASTVASDDGRYELAVAQGTYTLVADARSNGTPVHATVRSVAIGPATPLDVVIAGRPGGLVQFSGRLLDSDGAPIGGAVLALEGDTSTATDPEGRFALAVPTGKYNLNVVPSGPGGLFLSKRGFDLTRDRIGDITVALVTHDVTVRNSSGAPVVRSWVSIRPKDTDGWGWSESRSTDAGGHVRIQGLATRDLIVEATLPGTSEVVAKTVVDGRHPADVSLALPAPASTIRLSGAAFDTNGVTPAEPSFALSNANGTKGYGSQRDYAAGDSAFMIDAPAGTYTLTWSASTGPDEDWEGGDPTRDYYNLSSQQFHHDSARQIAFRLPSGPDLAVRVLDPQGAPVAGAVLTARSSAPAGSADFELAPGLKGAGTVDSLRVTGADGVARLRTLPGHLPTSVHVVAPSERGLEGDFAVAPGATSLDVHLKRGSIVSGTMRVGHEPGSPAWHVTFVSDDGNVSRPVSVESDGTYRVSVPPGTYSIKTDHDDDEPGGESDDHWNSTTSSSTFTVTGDRTLDLTFPASPGASVRFVDADGNPLEGEISLQSRSGEAFLLAPGIPSSGSAWFSAFGERDSAGIDAWPGGAIVSGALGSSIALDFSGIRMSPGGSAVVALAREYNLLRPDALSGVTGVMGGDGSATISWGPSVDGHGHPILGFHIQGYGPDSRALVVPASTTCVRLTGLVPQAHYSMYVSAMTVRGIGESSSAELYPPAAGAPNQGPSPACPPPGTPLVPPPDVSDPMANDGGFRPSTRGPSGYWALSSDGKVYNFGSAPHLGNGNGGAVDLEPTPTGSGYWTLNRNGVVAPFGDATSFGNVELAKLGAGEESASLSATPSGKGYWVFTNRGRVLAFGDAPFLGDMSGTRLNGPVLGSVATPSGKGYYMVASDGGIFAFGDAAFAGSMGGKKLNAPVQSLVPDADGAGYWLVASDGGIFAFDAPFRGSMGGSKLNKPISGMVRYGDGYLMVGADGGIFNFSSLPFAGSLGDKPPASPVVAVAALP